jgi:hypothetical protein
MKIRLSQKLKQMASGLLVVMVLGGILCTFVMYYLSLIAQQNTLSVRSQAWNIAIAITEAGLEEGLQQLNNNTANLAADGWSANGSVYSITRNLAGGNSYTVTIDLTGDPFHPSIVSRAYVGLPILAKRQSSAFFAAVGVPTTQTASFTRAVRVHCARGNLLIKGMVAKHRIDMNGNNILTDSFDSTDPSGSTMGHYDKNKARDNGDVATNDSFANSLGVGQANIYGHVMTGPGGVVAIGSQGAVGSHAWQPGHSGQIEPTYFTDNANFTFPEQTFPYTTGIPPIGGNISVTNYVLATNAVSSSTYPNPVPYGGVVTNVTPCTVSSWPGPQALLSTNILSTASTTTSSYPAPGTYVGSISTNWTGGKNPTIKSYNYTKITSVSYSYVTYKYNYSLYTTNYTVTSTYYDHILYSGDYLLSTPLSGKTLVLGYCRLIVPNGISMSGNDALQIGQLGSIQIYAGGSSCAIGGNGIINQNGYAVNCQVFCTPTVTSVSFNGNGEFIGVLVAPEASIQMNGGGHSDNDFIGALMASSVTMNGHFSFHYDEALGKNGANSRFIATSWDEIP